MAESMKSREKQAQGKQTQEKQSGINYFPILAAVIVVAVVAIVFVINRNGGKSGSSDSIAADDSSETARSDSGTVIIGKGDSLVIPVSDITEKATFYPIEVDGTSMEVLAIKASDGTIRTAFNTCQSCYTSGAGFYTMEEGDLVCNNCGFHFSPDQVEVSAGGCNPWPIYPEDKTVTDDTITISYDFLAESKDIFANWKTAMIPE